MIIPLQVVSESLAQSSPLLSSLLLMDNDIATVAEGALDEVKGLKQLDLTGKVQNVTVADVLSRKKYFDNSLYWHFSDTTWWCLWCFKKIILMNFVIYANEQHCTGCFLHWPPLKS